MLLLSSAAANLVCFDGQSIKIWEVSEGVYEIILFEAGRNTRSTITSKSSNEKLLAKRLQKEVAKLNAQLNGR